MLWPGVRPAAPRCSTAVDDRVDDTYLGTYTTQQKATQELEAYTAAATAEEADDAVGYLPLPRLPAALRQLVRPTAQSSAAAAAAAASADADADSDVPLAMHRRGPGGKSAAGSHGKRCGRAAPRQAVSSSSGSSDVDSLDSSVGRRRARKASAAAATATAESAEAEAEPVDEAAEASARTAADVLTVADLHSLLHNQYQESKSAARQHLVPLRMLAKVLHTRWVDPDTLQVSELLLQLPQLLQHMRDRLQGIGEATVLPELTAAQHIFSLIKVADLPEVQQQLTAGQVQQVVDMLEQCKQGLTAGKRLDSVLQQLIAKSAAEPTAGAGESPAADATALAADDAAPGRQADRRQKGTPKQQEQQRNGDSSAVAAAAVPRKKRKRSAGTTTALLSCAAGQGTVSDLPLAESTDKCTVSEVAAAAAATAAAASLAERPSPGSAQQQQAGSSEKAPGLSLSQLQQRITAKGEAEARKFASEIRPLRMLAGLVQGDDHKADKAQVPELLRQWPLLHQHMEQRCQQPEGTKGYLNRSSAMQYCQLLQRVLKRSDVCEMLGETEQQQLLKAVKAAAAKFRQSGAGEWSAHAVAPQPAAAAGSLSGVAEGEAAAELSPVTPGNRGRQQRQQPNALIAAAAAGAGSPAAAAAGAPGSGPETEPHAKKARRGQDAPTNPATTPTAADSAAALAGPRPWLRLFQSQSAAKIAAADAAVTAAASARSRRKRPRAAAALLESTAAAASPTDRLRLLGGVSNVAGSASGVRTAGPAAAAVAAAGAGVPRQLDASLAAVQQSLQQLLVYASADAELQGRCQVVLQQLNTLPAAHLKRARLDLDIKWAELLMADPDATAASVEGALEHLVAHAGG